MHAGSRPVGILAAATLALLICASPAAAVTDFITFDDQLAGTFVTDHYESKGVVFQSSEGQLPHVQASPLAISAPHVADIGTCPGGCGEGFFHPKTRARLTTRTANSVSAYVGYLNNPYSNEPLRIDLTAYDIGENALGTASVVAIEGAPFKKLEVKRPPGVDDIASVEISAPVGTAYNEPAAFDDLALTYLDESNTPNFGISASSYLADVDQGRTVEIPLRINRLNGSSGNVDFDAVGLPAGMTATFSPDPVGGAGTATTLRLTSAGDAPPSSYAKFRVTATPEGPGVGPSPRSLEITARVRENCDRRIRSDWIDVETSPEASGEGECLRRVAPGKWQYKASTRELRINGLQVKPASVVGQVESTLEIDTVNKVITSNDRWAVSDKPGAIELYVGRVHWDLGKGGDGASCRDGRGTATRCKTVFDGAVNYYLPLFGLPVKRSAIQLTKTGRSLTALTVDLRFWPFTETFGGITGVVHMSGDNDPLDRVPYEGVELKVGRVEALGIALKDIHLRLLGQGTWSGSATLAVRFATSYEIGAGFGIKDGDFDFLRASVGNINKPLGGGVFLQRLGLEVQRGPFALAGSIGLSAGPSVLGEKAVTADGTFRAVLADPFVLELTGNGKIADRYNLADVLVRFSSTGLFEVGGKVDWDLGVATAVGEVNGFVDGLRAFSLEGSLRACIRIPYAPDPCAGAAALVSSLGIAACVDLYLGAVGIGYIWGGEFDLFGGSCDLGKWRPAPGARKAQAGEPRRFTLPAGLPSAAWSVEGDGGAPGVTVTGPNGEAVTVSKDAPAAQAGGVAAVMHDNGSTFVVVKKPSAGVWTLTDDGSFPVKRVRQADGLPEPSVRGKVGGSGYRRTLSWMLKPIAGQSVSFVEIGKDVRRLITKTSARSGRVRFRPGDGPRGKRQIVALIDQDGRPRRRVVAATYTAPARQRPARPKKLRITRRGSRLVVTWSAPKSSFRHATYVQVSDSRKLLLYAGAGKRSLTVKGIGSKLGAKVTIVGLTQVNGKGPAASVSIKPRRKTSGKR